MASEKLIGSLFVIIGLFAIVYLLLFGFIALLTNDLQTVLYESVKIFDLIPYPPLIWVIWIVIAIAILIVALIFIWVGISLIKTPSLEEIDVEELEKEVEKELASQTGSEETQKPEQKEEQ